MPPQGDLGSRLTLLLGDLLQNRVVEDVALRDRRPCLGRDAVVGVECPQIVLRQIGVHLDLIHRGHDLGLGEEPLEVVLLKIRHSDGSRLAVGVDLLQRLPCLDEIPDLRQRPVDQEQVDGVDAQVGERLVGGLECVVVRVESVVELAGDEHLVARDVGPVDALTDLLLVAVHLGRVDVAVADVERGPHRVDRLLRLDLEHTETELRDLDAVVEGDEWDCHGTPFASMELTDTSR